MPLHVAEHLFLPQVNVVAPPTESHSTAPVPEPCMQASSHVPMPVASQSTRVFEHAGRPMGIPVVVLWQVTLQS